MEHIVDGLSKSHRSLRSAIIGMILGDGHIRDRGTICIRHAEQQKDYLLYKAKILGLKQSKVVECHPFDNSGYPAWRLETRSNPLYKRLRKILYIHGKKAITRKCLDYLDPIGISIWFQDDGSTSYKKRNGKIHAVELTLNTYVSKEENETIIAYFKERWNVSFGLNKSKGKHRLRAGTREGKKLVSLIEPYILPCMKYKIDKLHY
jgi:hypothetical protein